MREADRARTPWPAVPADLWPNACSRRRQRGEGSSRGVGSRRGSGRGLRVAVGVAAGDGATAEDDIVVSGAARLPPPAGWWCRVPDNVVPPAAEAKTLPPPQPRDPSARQASESMPSRCGNVCRSAARTLCVNCAEASAGRSKRVARTARPAVAGSGTRSRRHTAPPQGPDLHRARRSIPPPPGRRCPADRGRAAPRCSAVPAAPRGLGASAELRPAARRAARPGRRSQPRRRWPDVSRLRVRPSGPGRRAYGHRGEHEQSLAAPAHSPRPRTDPGRPGAAHRIVIADDAGHPEVGQQRQASRVNSTFAA